MFLLILGLLALMVSPFVIWAVVALVSTNGDDDEKQSSSDPTTMPRYDL